jgi:hypothetical protein
MKNIVMLLIALFAVGVVNAQDDRYVKAVEKNLAGIDSAKSFSDYLDISNNFVRIAKAEKDKWIPYYYASYCDIIASFIDSSKTGKDAYLDEADKYLSIADSLKADNSEIYTLKGFSAQARLVINPMARWQTYGQASAANLKKAKELDPSNPRPDYLIGESLLYTPEAFGGGKEKALPILESSLEKYKTFKPETSISPNWGGQMLKTLLEKIKGN